MNIKVDSIIFTIEYKTDINIDVDEIKNIRREIREELKNNNELTNEEKLKLHHIMSVAYYRENNPKEAIKSALKTAEYAKLIKNNYFLGRAYIWVAINNLILRDNVRFKRFYNMAEHILISMDKYEDVALFNSRVAVMIFRNNYPKEALRLCVEKTLDYLYHFETALSAQIYMSIASIYSIGLNDFELAIDIYGKALELARKYNIEDIEGLTLYYIGVGYFELSMNLKAINTFRGILNEERFKKNYPLMAIVALDLISVHLDNNIELDKVEDIIDSCEEYVNELDYIKKEQYGTQLNLLRVKHIILTDEGRSSDALVLLKNAEKIYKKYGFGYIFSHSDYYIAQLYGTVYFKLKNYKEAIKYYEYALETTEKYEARYAIEACRELSLIYEAMENYKSAFYYMNKANNTLAEIEHTDLIKKYIVTQNNYEKLRDQEKERNDFFATLSHELKTPINIIYSSIQLMNLFKDKSDKDFKEYYLKHEKSVKQNCLRMLKLVHNIIDMTKLDSGALKPNFVNHDIISLVEEITMSVLSSVEIKGINIIFDTDIEEKLIKCDPYMIERIMLNLLSNAIKFSQDNSEIFVIISKENDFISIKVKDTGIGIPEGMQKKIFEKFEQIDKSLNRKTEGSGIGLSLVSSLVDIHDGFIELDSIEGKGSEFKILLPDKLISNILDDLDIEKYDVCQERIFTELSDIYGLV
ncbi:ATP-binding protein [Clostridium sp.]|uniref:ATP-binding protein n=1 Tax=Clostridium sp. TaxID=1506 RepID=UPI003F405CBA